MLHPLKNSNILSCLHEMLISALKSTELLALASVCTDQLDWSAVDLVPNFLQDHTHKTSVLLQDYNTWVTPVFLFIPGEWQEN
jgi:hypothetical protein